VIPGGSMITKRVRKREPKTATSNTVEPCQVLRGDEQGCAMTAGIAVGRRSAGRNCGAQRSAPGAAKAEKLRGTTREGCHQRRAPETPPVARRVISPYTSGSVVNSPARTSCGCRGSRWTRSAAAPVRPRAPQPGPGRRLVVHVVHLDAVEPRGGELRDRGLRHGQPPLGSGRMREDGHARPAALTSRIASKGSVSCLGT